MTSEKLLTGKGVSFRNLYKRFGNFEALKDVSIDIHAGEFFTLLGPSGSGKTTLLKVIAGFEPHSAGTITIDGRDVSNVSVAKRNIGMVFQNYALFPHMTVSDNIAFSLQTRKMDRDIIGKKVNEVLELVDLVGYEDRLPRELSGGQQQRVALARSIVFDPDILLMDEPLGALDKNLRQNIQVELKQLHRKLGVTVVYVTHDQEEAMHLSDRITVMNEGRIEQSGSPQDLYYRPINKFVAGFIGEVNFVTAPDGSLRGIRPESMILGQAAENAAIRVQARITEMIFLGAGYKVILNDGKQQYLALTTGGEAVEGLSIGDSIWFGCAENQAFAVD
ncbi:MAG: ABC transporter ATP-binding protein [Rhodospirillales bacterium]|jgi:putative spermidine/putrescine transport system ATP-binding protein|nr:ABC transporter ATP-binding protein [Rhodospirillales bacterium]